MKGRDRKNLIIFSISRLISECGNAIFRFALSLYVLDVTGSAGWFAAVLSFSYLPTVLINVFAGVFVDRSNKKRVLVACDLLSGVLVLSFVPLFHFFPTHMGVIIFYTLLLSTLQSLFSLTVNAIVPELVSEERVSSLNSSSQSIAALLNIVGPVLGALAYSSLGMEWILWVDGFSFLLSGILCGFLIMQRKAVSSETQGTYLESLKEVYSYISKKPAIKNLLGVFVITNFIIAPSVSLVLPYIIYQVLDMSSLQLSYVEAAISLGIIVGALAVASAKVNDFVTNKIFILIQLQALTVLLWAFPDFLSLDPGWKIGLTLGYVGLLLFTGIFNAMGNIPMVSYVQTHIPEYMRARIFGVVGTVTTLSVPIGMWVYGWLLEIVHWSYLVVGSGVLLILVGGIAHQNKTLREFFSVKATVPAELKKTS